MANNKTGFNYYNLDTDRYQDIKIKRLKKNFGGLGIAIYDYILCEIYRVRGCYIEWDESTAFDVAEYFGLKESVVDEIVNYCCAVGLFSKELLTSGSVLTSQSIQKRYIEMCIRAKRKICIIPQNIKIPEEPPIIPEKSMIITEECNQNSVSLQQSKVKKSKEYNIVPFLKDISENSIEEKKINGRNDIQNFKTTGKEILNLRVLDEIIKITHDTKSTEFWLKAIKDLGHDRVKGILYELKQEIKGNQIRNLGAYLTKMLQNAMCNL